MALSSSPVTKQECRKIWPYRKPCSRWLGLAGKCETQLGTLNVSCYLSESFPLPHGWPSGKGKS
jgi:hypothetical protein